MFQVKDIAAQSQSYVLAALDGDEDGASHSRLNLRGIPAAYRAAREPGDGAEDFSSSARHMGRPL